MIMSFGKGRIPSLAHDVNEVHTNTYYENGILKRFDELSDVQNVCKVKYKDLPNTEISGYPFASVRGEDGELYFYFHSNSHEICVGTTGSGKTTGCVEPRLRALSSKKNKPCLFFTDPKGEVFEKNAKHLQKQGYKVYLINFKDVSHSDCWNPLAEIYDSWMRQTKLNGRPEFHSDNSTLDAYQLQDSREYFNNNTGFWTLGVNAFPSEDAVNRYITFERSIILSETEDLIHQLVHTLIPDTVMAAHDPSWMMGAQDILSGIIYAMLEDALDSRSGFTRDNMSLMTVQEYYDRIRDEVIPEFGQQRPLLKTKLLCHKSLNDTSIRQLKTYFENAPTTTRSYLGCFRNAMQEWFNSKLFTIVNGDTVKIDDFEETPFAIFLTTRDYEKSDFTVAGLFIDWVYRHMLLKADENGGTLSREMYFILDEFGNVPAIKDFENKIATARSRNIWFHMFVQSYAQLDVVYNIHCSQIIRDNCNSHSFLGSQNYETKSLFSKECGKRVIPELYPYFGTDNKLAQETALIPISALEELQTGQMYLRCMGLPLIQTRFERSYLCKEFQEDNFATPKEMNINSTPFNSEKYRYKYLSSTQSMEQFGNAETVNNEFIDEILDFREIDRKITRRNKK